MRPKSSPWGWRQCRICRGCYVQATTCCQYVPGHGVSSPQLVLGWENVSSGGRRREHCSTESPSLAVTGNAPPYAQSKGKLGSVLQILSPQLFFSSDVWCSCRQFPEHILASWCAACCLLAGTKCHFPRFHVPTRQVFSSHWERFTTAYLHF